MIATRPWSTGPVRWFPARLLCLLGSMAAMKAQESRPAGLVADETPVRWVDGRPMVKVTLRAGDKVYYCHLLLDLGTKQGLLLHGNAASVLRSRSCDIEAGGINLHDVAFEARRDPWLEGLTAKYAEPLQQVPVAGILGLSGLGTHDVVLDGPRGLLRLRAPTSGGEEVPASAVLSSVPFAGDFAREGVLVAADLGEGLTAKLRLHTHDPFSWLQPALCCKAGHPDGVLTAALIAPHFDLARWAPFRPQTTDSGDQGGIGGAVLQTMVITIAPQAGRVVFEHPAEPAYPETEAAFYRAAFGSSDAGPLRAFLQQYPDAPEAAEASAMLLARLKDKGGDAAALQEAGLAAIRAAAANLKGTAALEALADMADDQAAAPARQAIAEAGLAAARNDEDGNAVHKLRLELGRLARRAGDLALAYKHLLAAVFGMPISGPANLELGRLHEQQGQPERALGRYFLALLDARNSGEDGYVALFTLHAKLHPAQDLLAVLEEMADGRVPSFQPIPREPEQIVKTGRTVLVELFTGAQCPPCVAADVACDGVGSYYGRDEVVVVQWHLPIPGPEPMVSPASVERAGLYSVRGTPTVVVAGSEQVVGGGKADAIPDMFRKYVGLCDAELKKPPKVKLEGRAQQQADRVEVAAWVVPVGPLPAGLKLHAILVEDLIAYPGRNGILFHHSVARARLTPPEGAAVAGSSADEPATFAVSLGDVARDLDRLIGSYEKRGAFQVRPTKPDPARLQVVCYVEDGSSVLQALALPLHAAAKQEGTRK
jgi:hypothetical protein